MLGAALGTIARLTSTVMGDRPLRARTDLRVLLYHGVGPGTAPWLHGLTDEISADTFARQLAWVVDRYEVVALEEGIRRVLRERPARPLCAITFDDGLRSVRTHAWPLLRALGLRAAVFVNTAAIGNSTLLWQHYVSALSAEFGVETVYTVLAARTGCTDPAPRHLVEWCQHRFAALVRTDALATLDVFGRDRRALAEEHRPYLEASDLAQLAAEGMAIYTHTADHLPLAHVDPAMRRDQIDRCPPGANPAVISFPFGMRCDVGDEAYAYALTRYQYALAVEDGWNPRRRVRAERILRRVALTGDDPRAWHAALEVVPVCKGAVNLVRGR